MKREKSTHQKKRLVTNTHQRKTPPRNTHQRKTLERSARQETKQDREKQRQGKTQKQQQKQAPNKPMQVGTLLRREKQNKEKKSKPAWLTTRNLLEQSRETLVTISRQARLEKTKNQKKILPSSACDLPRPWNRLVRTCRSAERKKLQERERTVAPCSPPRPLGGRLRDRCQHHRPTLRKKWRKNCTWERLRLKQSLLRKVIVMKVHMSARV
nr:hypothetical protein BaRGS_014733 [Batillaria attramentaria]